VRQGKTDKAMDTQRQWMRDLKARLAAESKQFIARPRPMREWWAEEKAYYASLLSRMSTAFWNLPFAVLFGAFVWLVTWSVAWLGRTYTEILLPGSFDYSHPGGGNRWHEMQVMAIVFGVIAGLAFLVAMSDKSQSVKKRTGIQTRRRRRVPGRSHRSHRRREKS
jgi:hypothetical protein